jgi:hypothetical protein
MICAVDDVGVGKRRGRLEKKRSYAIINGCRDENCTHTCVVKLTK